MWSAFNANLPEIWVQSAPSDIPNKARTSAVLHDACTVCLRVTTTDIAALRSVMLRLSSNSVCILVHEEEYGTSALYVHSSRPLKQMLDVSTLSTMDIQPQTAWTFQLSPPYDATKIQELISYYSASQTGINAGYVNPISNLLTVFEDKDSTLPSSLANHETYNVCLSFQKDVCPFGDLPQTDQEEATICIRGNCSGLAELEAIKEALGAHREPHIKAMWINVNSLGLHVLPHSKDHLLQVRAFVLDVLGALGLQSSTKGNHLVLYEEERSPLPCAVEIKVGLEHIGRSPTTTAAVVANGKHGAYDLVTKLLWELGVNGQLKRRPNHVALSLSGCKCLKCGQAMVKALMQRNSLKLEITSIYLNLSRSVLMVTAVDEQATLCTTHMLDALSELGIQSAVMFTDPLDLDNSDSQAGEEECQSYIQSLKPSNKAIAPSAGLTEVAEIGFLPEAIRCYTCSDLLQSTLRIVVPGLRNLAINVKAAELLVEYEVDHVSEADLLARLTDLGYQPQVIARGKHLQQKLYGDLLTPCEEPLPVKRGSLSDSGSLFGLPDGECVARCPVRLIIRSTIDTIKDEIIIVYSFSQDVVPLNTAFQKGATESMRMYVQDPLTGIVLPIEDATLADAELEFPYTVWYDKVVDRSRVEQPITKLQTCKTLQQFWKVWSSIDLNKLQERDVLMLFRDSILPELNHPANRTGGRWYTRALPMETRRKLWIAVVLAVVGQTLQDNTCNEVCGVVLSVKPGGDRIEVWVDGGYHHQLKYGHERAPLYRQLSSTMGDILGRVLKVSAGPQRLHYWTHEAYERHRRLHSGSARRDKRKQYAKQLSLTTDESVGSPDTLGDGSTWCSGFGD